MKSINTGRILAIFTLLYSAQAAKQDTNTPPTLPQGVVASKNTHYSPSSCNGFVTVKNGHFYVGDRLFDFKSMNAPDLMDTLGNDVRVVDTMKTFAGLGSPVTRTYTLNIYNSLWGRSTSQDGSHIGGWDASANDWIYNEPGFVRMDKMLAHAADHGVKVIIPIINQDYGSEDSDYVGNYVDLIRHRYGISNYTAAQNKLDFFTDLPFRADYKKIVKFLLTRRNTINGRIYGNDDVILAWETGNEMNWGSANHTVHKRPAPADWTIDIAKQLKSLAPRTLVMDGSFSRDPTLANAWPIEVLRSKYVDLFSYHMYGSGDALLEPSMNKYIKSFGKVFVIGEHGFYSTGAQFTSVISGFTSAGSLIWGMRPHHEESGFVTHGEGSDIYSYHFPGWSASNSTNFDARELAVSHTTFENSWKFIGKGIPQYPVPGAPVLHDASNGTNTGISWQGATWAQHYELYAAPLYGEFELISDYLLDNVEGGTLFVPVDPNQASERIVIALPEIHHPGSSQWTDPKWSSGRGGNHHGMAKRDSRDKHGRGHGHGGHGHGHHGGHGHGHHGGHGGGHGAVTFNGAWYVLRGISVEGHAGPWSFPVFISTP